MEYIKDVLEMITVSHCNLGNLECTSSVIISLRMVSFSLALQMICLRVSAYVLTSQLPAKAPSIIRYSIKQNHCLSLGPNLCLFIPHCDFKGLILFELWLGTYPGIFRVDSWLCIQRSPWQCSWNYIRNWVLNPAE